MRLRTGVGLLAAVLAAAALADTRRVRSTIVVNSTADVHDVNPGDGVCETASGNGVCTLRAAVEEANAGSGGDTIIFSQTLPNPSTFQLTNGRLRITVDTTVVGRGTATTIVDGNGGQATIQVDPPATVTISHLTIRGGNPGIFAQGSRLNLSDVVVTQNSVGFRGSGSVLTLDHCTISDNSGGGIIDISSYLIANDSTIEGNSTPNQGGGIFQSEAYALISRSVIAGNTAAGAGGGLYVTGASEAPGQAYLINTTVSGNASGDRGGGVFCGDADCQVFNATITNNQSATGSSLFQPTGGGIGIDALGGVFIENTLLAGNFHPAGKAFVADDCVGALDSLDYNLIQTTGGCTITGGQAHNIYGTAPQLGPLQDNGGPTRTQALLAGSPAIDAGNPSGCTDPLGPTGATLTTDQRGFVRPINGRCDMGAYEFGSPGPLGRSFFTLAPCRVIDTRGASGPLGGPALAAGATRDFVLVGTCGIPASAKAVSANVTVTAPTAAGDLRLFAGGASVPLVSTINYRAMQTRANNAIVTLGASGDIDVRSDQASGAVHFIFDVNGYFQ